MHHSTDLRILFPTSFSDSCFRTARAIAQLADTCRVGLTIAHVVKPGKINASIERELNSFMAEADHYDRCERVLVEAEDPIHSIAGMCENHSFDLIAAPASDRLGVHRMFTRSFRTRLLKHCRTPLWTAGRCLDYADFKGRIRTIACLVDFDLDNTTYLRLATAFAARFEARLRIVGVLPEISEATLARSLNSIAPLVPEAAVESIRQQFAGRDCPEVDVVVGELGRELPRLLRKCEANLAFIGPGQALGRSWLPRGARHLDRLPCPVVCIDGASKSFKEWTFEQHETRREAAPRTSLVHTR